MADVPAVCHDAPVHRGLPQPPAPDPRPARPAPLVPRPPGAAQCAAEPASQQARTLPNGIDHWGLSQVCLLPLNPSPLLATARDKFLQCDRLRFSFSVIGFRVELILMFTCRFLELIQLLFLSIRFGLGFWTYLNWQVLRQDYRNPCADIADLHTGADHVGSKVRSKYLKHSQRHMIAEKVPTLRNSDMVISAGGASTQ